MGNSPVYLEAIRHIEPHVSLVVGLGGFPGATEAFEPTMPVVGCGGGPGPNDTLPVLDQTAPANPPQHLDAIRHIEPYVTPVVGPGGCAEVDEPTACPQAAI